MGYGMHCEREEKSIQKITAQLIRVCYCRCMQANGCILLDCDDNAYKSTVAAEAVNGKQSKTK